MARVAYFIESLPPTDDLIARFAYGLARSLAEQQHEILVLSTYRAGHPGPRPQNGISIALPFRSWSWLEAARCFPALLRFQPEILHFVQPHGECLDGWTNAMSLLPAIAKSAALAAGAAAAGPGRSAAHVAPPAIVSSFFDLRADWRRQARVLLAQSHAVTAASSMQLEQLRSEFIAGREPLTALTPLGFVEAASEAAPSDAQRTSEAAPSDSYGGHRDKRGGALAGLLGRELILAPGDVDAHDDPERLFRLAARLLRARPQAAFAIAGGWGRLPPRARFALMRSLGDVASRFALLGARSEEARARALAQASLAFAPTLSQGSLVLAEIAREALKQSAFLLATDAQLSADAQLAASAQATGAGELAWGGSAPDGDEPLVEAALRALDRKLASAGSPRGMAARESARRELADSPANVISRLYARALAERRSFLL
jgi:glycosyltransferase involved in cell wall biosynthesis